MSEVDILTPPPPAAGHNRPPIAEWYREQNEALPGYVDAELTDVLKRVEELSAALGRLPDKIETAEVAGNYTQLIGFLTKCIQNAEAKRVDMTEGPLQAQRTIMERVRMKVFSRLGEPKTDKNLSWGVGSAKQIAQDRLTVWDKAQAEIRRKALEEEERRAREAAAEAERIAAAERERVAREQAAAAEAQRKAEEAIRNERDLERAVQMEAENKRLQAQREIDEREAAARAETARLEAEKAAEAATAKSSTLTHSVGAYGAKSTLRDNWKGRIIDREKANANLAKIAPFLSVDAVIAAASAFAKKDKNTTKIEGFEFYNDERSQVRS